MSLTTYHKITREQFALNKQPQVILLTFEKFIRSYLFQKRIALGNNCQGKNPKINLTTFLFKPMSFRNFFLISITTPFFQ